MPHWRTMIEKDHLGAWDLVGPDGKPKEFTLEIARVDSKLLKTVQKPKGHRKCVVTFKGARKQFVCNTTNAQTIESLYGAETDGWVGKRVTLYQADVRDPNGRGTVKGIRVKSRAPSGPAETVPEREVDEDMRAQQNAAFGGEERQPGQEG